MLHDRETRNYIAHSKTGSENVLELPVSAQATVVADTMRLTSNICILRDAQSAVASVR